MSTKTSCNPRAISNTFSGFTIMAASPTTSGRELTDDVTTGMPVANLLAETEDVAVPGQLAGLDDEVKRVTASAGESMLRARICCSVVVFRMIRSPAR